MKKDSRISKFVLTLGVNLNTNGTALFLAISSIFISRLNGVTLTYSTLFTILLMVTVSSMSIPSAPSSSLVMLLVILTTIDVDARDISLLFAVDWMLYVWKVWTWNLISNLKFYDRDRCRTTSNVLGDCFAAAVIEQFSKKDLIKMDAAAATIQHKPENEMLIQSVWIICYHFYFI